MAYFTKSQVRKILNDAPPGTSRAGIIAQMRKKGHIIEGLNEKKSFFGKVGDFVAPLGETLGKSLGQRLASKEQEKLTQQQTQSDTAIARQLRGKSPREKQRLISRLKRAGVDVTNLGDRLTVQEQTPGLDISNKQVAGEAIVTAGNILGFGQQGGAGTISRRVNAPLLRSLTATPTRQLATTTGLQSAVIGAGASIADDDSLNTIVQKTALSFATGFGTSLLFSKLFNSFANKQQKFVHKTEGFAKEAIRPTGDVAGRINRDIAKEATGELPFGRGLLNKIIKRYRGNAEQVRQASTLDIAKYGDEIKDVLQQVDDAGAPKISRVELLDRVIKNTAKELGELSPGQQRALKNVIREIPENMTVSAANAQKTRLAGLLRGFAPNAKTEAVNKEMIRALWGATKETIEDRARLVKLPVDELMENFSIATDVNGMISRVIDQALKQPGGLGARFRGAGPLNLIGNIVLGMRAPRLLRSAGIAQQKVTSPITRGLTGFGRALQKQTPESIRKGLTSMLGGPR